MSDTLDHILALRRRTLPEFRRFPDIIEEMSIIHEAATLCCNVVIQKLEWQYGRKDRLLR